MLFTRCNIIQNTYPRGGEDNHPNRRQRTTKIRPRFGIRLLNKRKRLHS